MKKSILATLEGYAFAEVVVCINGLDLLDDKYGLANNNLPANAVDQVQVLENHQPIKALDSFSTSNRAAINIKLNTGARNRIIGKAKIGAGGSPLLLDNELVPMKFGKNSQSIVAYKYTNAGYAYADELTLLNSSDFLNGIKGFVDKVSFVDVLLPALPNIKKYRFLFNNLHTVSINHLIKSKGNYEWKINMDYVNDVQKQTTGSRHRIFFSQDTIEITEKQDISKRQEMFRAFTTVVSNTEKRYLKNTTSINIVNDRNSGFIYARDSTQQYAKNKVQSFFNDFSWMKVKHKWATSIASFISYSNQPQVLQIQPGKYESILNNSIAYTSMVQNVDVSNFYANQIVSFSRRYRWISVENKTGFNYQVQHFTSALSTMQANALLPTNDSFYNNFKGKQLTVFNSINLSVKTKRFWFVVTLPISYFDIKNLYDNTNTTATLNKVIINSTINVHYTFNSDWTMDAEATTNTNYFSTDPATNRFVLKNYRSIANQNGIVQPYKNKNLKLNVGYKNVLKYLFANLGASAEKNTYSNLFDQQYIGSLLISNAVLQPNPNTSYGVFGNISKFIYSISTSVSISMYAQKRFFNQLQQSKSSQFFNNLIGVSAKANTNVKAWSMEYNGSYQQNTSGFSGAKTNGKMQVFNQSLSLAISLPRSYLLKCTVDQNEFKQGNLINRNYYFADISVRKQIAKPKLDFELLWQNIFDTKSFSTFGVFSNNEINNFYSIRPSQILVKVSFLF